MLFSAAIFVFTMMLIGLGLTIWDFMRGEPRAQRIARAGEISGRERATRRKAA